MTRHRFRAWTSIRSISIPTRKNKRRVHRFWYVFFLIIIDCFLIDATSVRCGTVGESRISANEGLSVVLWFSWFLFERERDPLRWRILSFALFRKIGGWAIQLWGEFAIRCSRCVLSATGNSLSIYIRLVLNIEMTVSYLTSKQ